MSRDPGDDAISKLIEAAQEPDVLRQQNKLRAAQVYATLALRGSVDELRAVVRDVARAEWRARHRPEAERRAQ